MAAAGAPVREKKHDFLFDLFDGDDVPEVDGHEVGDEYVNFRGGVHRLLGVAAACMQIVVTVVMVASGFDLNTPEAVAGVEDEVVAFAIAPGLGDTKAEAGGFVKESEFGDFAATFGPKGSAHDGCFHAEAGVLVGLPVALEVGQGCGRLIGPSLVPRR